MGDFHTVRREINAYGADLVDKPFLVAITKVDALAEEDVRNVRQTLSEAIDVPVVALSAHTGIGMPLILDRLFEIAKPSGGRAETPTVSSRDDEQEPWSPI
ncbi:MAG: hypothetical protein AAGF15_08015 [Pseudomonadota bacterium]